jgi:tetratricopeptide (TPR) repeat protein
LKPVSGVYIFFSRKEVYQGVKCFRRQCRISWRCILPIIISAVVRGAPVITGSGGSMKKTNVFKTLFSAFVLLAGLQVQAQSQSVETLMANGQELLQRGAYSQAAASFKQALAREPDFFEAQFNLGFTYLQWGKYSEAVVELKKALKLQSGTKSEVWSNLAIAYDNLNRPNDAMDALAQAVNADPGNLTARMNLAAMYANANKTQQAIAQYKQVIKMDGTSSEAYLNLSKCLMTAGNIEEAKQFLKQSITSDPNKGEPHQELGNIYWKKDNDIDKGIAEYRIAVSVEPSVPAFYESLAIALESKGQKEEACEVWKKSLVYIDDAMAKEKVQDRIDRLEKGAITTPAGGSGGTDITSQQTRDLEREMRAGNPSESRRMESGPVDVGKDLSDINKTDDNAWDLEKEAQKRAKDKKKKKK